jgi:hypothetical protein
MAERALILEMINLYSTSILITSVLWNFRIGKQLTMLLIFNLYRAELEWEEKVRKDQISID